MDLFFCALIHNIAAIFLLHQLGLGSVTNSILPVPIPTFSSFAGRNRITYINAGARHAVAFNSSGQLYSWGWNRSDSECFHFIYLVFTIFVEVYKVNRSLHFYFRFGQLGLGHTKDSNIPQVGFT